MNHWVANEIAKPLIAAITNTLFPRCNFALSPSTQRKRLQRKRLLERELNPEEWAQNEQLKKAKKRQDEELKARAAERKAQAAEHAKEKRAECMRRQRLKQKLEVGGKMIILELAPLLSSLISTIILNS